MDREKNGGSTSSREVPVWDPLVRLIHWSVAFAILLNGALLDAEGKLHEWVGYAALCLVGVRLFWGMIGPRMARFTAFPPDPFRAMHHLEALRRGDRTVHLSHNPLGALMVYNIWLTILAIMVTGVMMGTRKFFGVDWVESLHEVLFNWLMISVALHVAGVVFDSKRSGVPLVRAMLTGRKRIPEGVPVE